MKLVTVYGSPTPPGKLARALTLLERHVAARPGWTIERVAPRAGAHPLQAWWHPEAAATVAEADAVVIASPVFRGSMPGTLKLLLDLLPADALRSKPVGVLTVAAEQQYHFGAERHLRDVLSWFGALAAPSSAFFVGQTFASDEVEPRHLTELEEFSDQVTVLSERTSGFLSGPNPLKTNSIRER